MRLGLNLGLGGRAQAAGTPAAPSYHPDDDLLGIECYLIADADDVALTGSLVDEWQNRGTVDLVARDEAAGYRPTWDDDYADGFPGIICDYNAVGPVYQYLIGRNGADSANVGGAAVHTVSSKFGIVVVTPLAPARTANTAGNVFAENTGYWGLGIYSSAGVPKAEVMNFSGSYQLAEVTCTVAARQVIAYRHTGGVFSVSVNGGAWADVSSGDSGALGTRIQWAERYDGATGDVVFHLACASATEIGGAGEFDNVIARICEWAGV